MLDLALSVEDHRQASVRPQRLLVALSPRVLSDSLLAILDLPDTVEVVAEAPETALEGEYDVALVDRGVDVDARVRIELLGGGGCIVTDRSGQPGVTELRHAIDLVALVAAHLGVERNRSLLRDLEGDPRAAVGPARHDQLASR